MTRLPDEPGQNTTRSRTGPGRQAMQPAGTPDDAAIRALGASQLGVPVDEVTAVAVRRFRAALQAACAAPTDEAVEVLRQAAAPVRDRVRAGHLSAQPELTDAPGEDHPPSA